MTKNHKIIVSISDYWDQKEQASHFNTLDLKLTWFETYLLNKVIKHADLQRFAIETVHVLGCGTGREIYEIARRLKGRLIASDFSPNMINACQANIKKWGLDGRVSTAIKNISSLCETDEKCQIAFAFNNTFNYLTPLSYRESCLKSVHSILEKGGYFVGVVHSQYGTLNPTIKGYLKAIYFLFQKIFDFINEPGDRVGGNGKLKSKFHYYTKNELKLLLESNEFEIIDLKSLGSLSQSLGRGRYTSAYNNIIFIAKKL